MNIEQKFFGFHFLISPKLSDLIKYIIDKVYQLIWNLAINWENSVLLLKSFLLKNIFTYKIVYFMRLTEIKSIVLWKRLLILNFNKSDSMSFIFNNDRLMYNGLAQRVRCNEDLLTLEECPHNRISKEPLNPESNTDFNELYINMKRFQL